MIESWEWKYLFYIVIYLFVCIFEYLQVYVFDKLENLTELILPWVSLKTLLSLFSPG